MDDAAAWFEFQLTAARRRLAEIIERQGLEWLVSTHSRPKAAGQTLHAFRAFSIVSTHSRPKAAGFSAGKRIDDLSRFNSQPPEGGWVLADRTLRSRSRFNSQPPEGGWRLR